MPRRPRALDEARAALGARIIVAHPGSSHGLAGDELHVLVAERLTALAPKVEHLGVGLGLETAGKTSAFGTLGDIALLAERFSFVRPVVDWAHLHAISQGGLSSKEGFAAVFAFLIDHFPAWMIDPLHTQFTANQFGPSGEIRHVPYGTTELGHPAHRSSRRGGDLPHRDLRSPG